MLLKLSIKYKITLFICLAVLIAGVIGIGTGYFLGFNLLRSRMIISQLRIAEAVSSQISIMTNMYVTWVEGFSNDPFIIDMVRKGNLKYRNMQESAISQQLQDMDRRWVSAEPGSLLLKEYLESPESSELKRVAERRKDVVEIFITDKFGGLLASSGRTTDFYQADEDWWQAAFAKGSGGVFISNIEFDRSSNTWGVTFAVPIRDESGSVIGVTKAIVDTKSFFALLDVFRIGKTGDVAIVDRDCNVLYRRGVLPLSAKFCSKSELEKLFKSKSGGEIISLPEGEKNALVSFVRVQTPTLLIRGIDWMVFVSEDMEEAAGPLYQLTFQFGIVSFIILIMSVVLGLILGGIFSRPLKTLHEFVLRVRKGKLDRGVEIKSGDEIEELAGAFNELVSELKDDRLRLQGFTRNLEDEVRKRTEDLVRAQEAALNMLEDMQETNIQLRTSQDQLIQSAKLASLGDLVSKMAHEVNNPLMIISGNAQLSLMEELKNKELEKNLKVIVEQADRAKDIIQRLLLFSKPSRGELKDVNINDTLEFVVKLIEHQFELSNIRIVKNYAADLPFLRVDEKQMEEVFMNILKNSSEAMPDGGTITITTTGEKDKVSIVLSDTGRGMLKETIAKLFEPFFSTKPKGTGLGLPICYGIIKAHGGQIQYESEEGKGASAIITLPVRKQI